MTTEPGDEERTWAADKRDFIADWRDSVADGREKSADERERIADDREAELNRWEHRLVVRAQELGLPRDDATTAEQHEKTLEKDARDRRLARADRARSRASRDRASEERAEHARPTLLALAFARIAEELYRVDSVDDVLLRVAEAAVSTVRGCGMASVTLAGARGYSTPAFTHPAALDVDLAQYQVDEGPSLDALSASEVYAPAFPDGRWPALGSRPTESGVHSAVSYHLTASSPATPDPAAGSLNVYGLVESAFDADAREIGLILAVHASAAVQAVANRESLEESGRALQRALMSRDIIGQAKGILMERLKITPDDAFDILRRASQNLNVKLRQVAEGLVETGELNQSDN